MSKNDEGQPDLMRALRESLAADKTLSRRAVEAPVQQARALMEVHRSPNGPRCSCEPCKTIRNLLAHIEGLIDPADLTYVETASGARIALNHEGLWEDGEGVVYLGLGMAIRAAKGATT